MVQPVRDLFKLFFQSRNCLFEFKKLGIKAKQALLLDNSKVDDENAAGLIYQLIEKNVAIAIFDITNKFNVPTYHCIISDNTPIRKLGHQSGTGTHTSKGVAISRAITEAAQSRLTHISGARDDMFSMNYQYEWGELETMGDVSYQDRSSFNVLNKTLDEQVSYLLNIFESKGYDKVVCVDHTSDDELIAVVHAIVPGLNI